jgi:hypothetical protein
LRSLEADDDADDGSAGIGGKRGSLLAAKNAPVVTPAVVPRIKPPF